MYALLCIDLCKLIHDYLDFINLLPHRIVCKRFKSIKIYDFYNIDSKYLYSINDVILKKFNYIDKLNAQNNPRIKTLNHITKLKKLNISGYCGANDQGISDLNLEEFDTGTNPRIMTLNQPYDKIKKIKH